MHRLNANALLHDELEHLWFWYLYKVGWGPKITSLWD